MSRNEEVHQNELNEALVKETQERESDDHHEEFNGASFTGGVLNLATTIMGAGIMALPATMKILGLVPGIVMIVLTAFLTEKTIELLLRFSGIGNARSYGGLMQDSFGRPGRIALQVSVLFSNLGVLIVYMIIIGGVFKDMVEAWLGKSWWDTRVIVLLVTTLCLIAPLTCFRRIDALKYTSAISLFLAAVFLVFTGVIVVTKLYRGGLVKPKLFPNVTDLSSVWKLFTVIPVLVNAYICHSNGVHNIQSELADTAQIRPVVRSALTISSSVYIMTSLFGYLLFGESTCADVLENFEKDLHIPFGVALGGLVRLSYAAHLVLVFPIIFYPLRVNIDGLFFPTAPPLATSHLRFGSITACLIALIFVGANFFPSIWNVFQLTGATASACIGFIFPASVILKNRHNSATNMDKTIAILVIVLAVFSNAIAMYCDIYALLVKKEKSTFAHYYST